MSKSADKLLNLASDFERMAQDPKKIDFYFNLAKYAGAKISFRPGEVKDVVSTILEMMSPKPKYNYDAKGSTVEFTGGQFHHFVREMKAALDSDIFSDEEKAEIQDTLNHVMSQLPSA